MNGSIKNVIKRIPILNKFLAFLDSIKLKWLEGVSFLELIKFYVLGILQGDISYRAAAISFSFFMALFPFLLFILNLIPYIPIDGFQEDFIEFVRQNVPPTTFDAIYKIISDILTNSYKGLLSTGFIMSIFLMTNGVNAIMSGFETSKHVSIKRAYFRQYFVALVISFTLVTILLITITAIVVFEVIIQKTIIQDVLTSKVSSKISLIELSRYAFVILMVLISIAILFKFGIKQTRKRAFITIGTVFTTILIILSSYFFGIWVVKFSKYNELYGSIGTLLVVMFYIWINCMVLLLGFELDASISKLKHHHTKTPQL